MNETYRILIADDEPLVQIGLKSMLDRDFPSFEVAGTASNGREALELIGKLSPDIVISDIKMPIMSGLELIEKSHGIHGSRPVFIMLTAYEDFNMARSAFSNEACDYLVKIELSTEALGKALDHAVRKLDEISGGKHTDASHDSDKAGDVSDEEFRQIFAIKLLNNVFTDRNALMTQASENRIDLSYDRFIVVYGSLGFEGNVNESRMLTLYSSTAAMTRDILGKYAPSYMVANDRQHFTFIFYFNEWDAVADEMELIQDGLDNAIEMINNYFSVKLYFGIGTAVSDPTELHVSFEEARTAIERTDENTPIRFFSHIVGANRRSGKDRLIASIQQYVEDNLGGRLQLSEVAETFGLSAAYLSTIFKKSTDVGFSEYVYTKKIEKAKEMLLNDDMKIYEVADALSFESSYYFSKVFKKVEGISPREWINSKL